MADASPKTQTNSASQLPSDPANPSKFFLYKAALVTVFLLLLPLFPSLAPDFINQTLHARSWELLQLIFVGIAVSYGLFSKKNDEPHKDNPISKMDNAQSYMSKLLQVSSVFDDESDIHTEIEESKFQALNSQYYRGEPVVVVSKEHPTLEETNGVVALINQKPLLLPVRSLKQRVPSPNELDLSDDSGGMTRASSRAGLTNSLRKPRIEEENVVLRSPIPWRSRSGRMEMKKDGDDPTPFSASPSMEEAELNRVESRSFRSSTSRANASESQCKGSCEDGVRKKSFASPPPAPPPPPPPPSPPPFFRKSALMKSSSSIGNKPNAGSPEKVLRRSVRSVPTEELNEREIFSGADSRPGLKNSDGVMKSVRTFRLQESKDYEMEFINKKGCSDAVQTYTTAGEEEEEQKKKEKMVVEATTEEESGEEEDTFEESPSGNGGGGGDGGPDVDKKADEFIAKFREQIRLQRIESIRRSTAQRAGKSLR